MVQFNLSELFTKVFGYKSEAFEPKFDDQPRRTEFGKAAASNYYDIEEGREFYLPVELVLPYEEAEKIPGMGDSNRWSLPFPVISFHLNKLIIETGLTDRRGTVKELINTGDYRINVKGFIINQRNEFPEDDFTTLCRIVELNIPLKINNVITDIILIRPERSGSDDVVITNMRFPPANGVKHVRAYELEIVSDEPFNLIDITSTK